jgi:hypothetical protein
MMREQIKPKTYFYITRKSLSKWGKDFGTPTYWTGEHWWSGHIEDAKLYPVMLYKQYSDSLRTGEKIVLLNNDEVRQIEIQKTLRAAQAVSRGSEDAGWAEVLRKLPWQEDAATARTLAEDVLLQIVHVHGYTETVAAFKERVML